MQARPSRSWEAAELLEEFSWQTSDVPIDEIKREAIAQEMADVLIYLLHLADALNIDLVDTAWAKHEAGGSSGGGLNALDADNR